MHLDTLANKESVLPLVYSGPEVPHATIECNRQCNIQCRSCYNLVRDYTKPLSLVKQEIRHLLSLRRLQALTIVGGEPTLYPWLAEVVRYVKEQGCFCQILTNGRVFLNQPDNSLLVNLKSSGADRLLIHIDEGQSDIHPHLDETRHRVFEKLEKFSLHFALSVTVYDDNQQQLGRLSRRYAGYRYFDGILAVLAKDPYAKQDFNASLTREYDNLRNDPGLEPSFYIPSTIDDTKITWLGYYYFIDPATGNKFGISGPLLSRFNQLYRLLYGRNFFTHTVKPGLIKLLFYLVRAFSRFINGKTPCQPGKLQGNPESVNGLRLHLIIIQEPPSYNEKAGKTELCRTCMDATVRQGRLVPVCLADIIEPFDGINRVSQERKNRVLAALY
jgi:organic radical activating enzyme